MALSKPIGDVIAEELECSICLDRLKSPRMLTCLHSFCEHCLQGFADLSLDEFLHCPTCREKTVMPNVGIIGLKPDFRANKLLEVLNKDRTSKQSATSQQNCSVCKSSEACLICEECDLEMCHGCADFHGKMPMCQNHQTIPLMDRSSESVDVETSVVIPKCTRHDEQLKFYCKSCKICICADCTVLDHSKVDGHECMYLKEIVPQFRRDVAELVAQVDVKAKDLDSLFAKIVSTKQELDRKSTDIDRNIETEVARIKTFLLDQNHDYIEKNREAITDIEQRNRTTKKNVQDVARVLRQVASSNDDREVAEMHHSLLESVRKIIDNDSDSTALDNVQTKFTTVKLKCTHDDSSQHPSINLVQQGRVLEQQNVPNAARYYAVGRKNNETLSVIYATQSGQVSCHDLRRNATLAMLASLLANRPAPEMFSLGVGNVNPPCCFNVDSPGTVPTDGSRLSTISLGSEWQKSSAFGTFGTTFLSQKAGLLRFPHPGRIFRCPYDILPSGEICYVTGDKLYKGSIPLTLHALHQVKDSRCNDSIHQCPSLTVNTKGYIYVATVGLNCLLEIAPNNTILSSKPIGNILPFAITTCNTSPCETFLIAHKPASVSLTDSQQNIRCIFSDREGVLWENAAITCGTDGQVYLLSSQDSKVTLQILDKEGNIHETIFRDRHVSSQNQSPPKQPVPASGFVFGGSAPVSGSLFGSPYAPQPEAGATFNLRPSPRSSHASSQNQLPPKQPVPAGEFVFGGPTSVIGSFFGPPYVPQTESGATFNLRPSPRSTTSQSSPPSQHGLGPRLSVAVASNGDIAAVLGEDELVLITMQEIDIRKA